MLSFVTNASYIKVISILLSVATGDVCTRWRSRWSRKSDENVSTDVFENSKSLFSTRQMPMWVLPLSHLFCENYWINSIPRELETTIVQQTITSLLNNDHFATW